MNSDEFFCTAGPWRQYDVAQFSAVLKTAQIVVIGVLKHFGKVEKLWD